MVVARRCSRAHATQLEAGTCYPQNHWEVAIDGCTGHLDTCETKGISSHGTYVYGGGGKNYFEEEALFSPR